MLGYVLEDLEAEKHGTRPILSSATDGDEEQRRVLELLAEGANEALAGRRGPMNYKGGVMVALTAQDERDLALIAKGAGVSKEVKAAEWVKEAIDREVTEALGASAPARRAKGTPGPRWREQGAPRHRSDPAELDTACAEVLGVLRAHKDGLNKVGIREATKGDRALTDAAIQKLVRTGKLERKGITSKMRYLAV